jgi:hypothetical protein
MIQSLYSVQKALLILFLLLTQPTQNMLWRPLWAEIMENIHPILDPERGSASGPHPSWPCFQRTILRSCPCSLPWDPNSGTTSTGLRMHPCYSLRYVESVNRIDRLLNLKGEPPPKKYFCIVKLWVRHDQICGKKTSLHIHIYTTL